MNSTNGSRSIMDIDPKKKFIGLTAEQYLEKEFAPKEPLIEGLLHRRDLVAFGARRRNGKTTFLTNLAVAMAIPVKEFLGYPIPEPRRSLLLMLEDDPGEYQGFLKNIVGERDTQGRIRVLTREDFRAAEIPLDVRNANFQSLVRYNASIHEADLIVLDNLAQVIGADYMDSTKMQQVMSFCYRTAADCNAAIIIAAHPRKDAAPEKRISLQDDSVYFFESIMGSSQFINSTGWLWGMERREDGISVFVGGRQRSEGHEGLSYIYKGDDGWFHIADEAKANLPLVIKTQARQHAWGLLPAHPIPFGYREGEEMVKSAMKSSSTYAAWMKECRRLGVIVDTPDGRLVKAPGV